MPTSSMRQPVGSGRHVQGFTLIEILVVIVVVGLLASIAVVNFGSTSQTRELENHARDVFLQLQLAADQAVLNNQELGLAIKDQTWTFVVYDEETGAWQPLPPPGLKGGVFPEWVSVDVQREGERVLAARDAQDEAQLPQIALFSSGEVTPFELRLRIGKDGASAKDEARTYVLFSDGVNGLDWRKPGEEPQ